MRKRTQVDRTIPERNDLASVSKYQKVPSAPRDSPTAMQEGSLQGLWDVDSDVYIHNLVTRFTCHMVITRKQFQDERDDMKDTFAGDYGERWLKTRNNYLLQVERILGVGKAPPKDTDDEYSTFVKDCRYNKELRWDSDDALCWVRHFLQSPNSGLTDCDHHSPMGTGGQCISTGKSLKNSGIQP